MYLPFLNSPTPMALRIFLFAFLSFVAIHTSAQPGAKYSIKDGKSIKLYEESLRAYELGFDEEAMQLLDKVIDKSPSFSEAFLLRAQIYADRKQSDSAIADLERVVEIGHPDFSDAGFYLGDQYMQHMKYEKADAAFAAFIAKGSRDKRLLDHAALHRKSCAFAQVAIQNPVPFEPINLGEGINSEMSEYFPCLTADHSTLLYTREVHDARVRGGRQEDFYVSTRLNGVWQPSAPVLEINTVFNEGAPTLSADGQWLIFTACESAFGDWGKYSGLGSCDLFSSRLIGDQWSAPVNINQVNSYDWDSQPSFSSDGKTLYFIRGKQSARGIQKQDIYFSELRQDGSWTKPAPIPGKVNTPFEEESVMIHPDCKTLYFSSNGHPGMGGLDIYFSKKQADGTWGEPVNLGYPINTGGNENSLLVSPDGEIAYFASDRIGGFGGLDLYQFVLPEAVRPEAVSFVQGEVFDAVSYKKLEARLELIDLETGNVVIESYSNPGNGSFLVVLPPGRDYALNVSRSGYLFYSQNFSLKAVAPGDPVMLEVPLDKLRVGNSLVLNNVFFDTDSDVLKGQSKTELDRLVDLLLQNGSMRVEIGGHTDAIGSEDKNLDLSKRRAQAVVNYIVEHGISVDRLTSTGFGESKPVASNETEEGRALNRRTEVRITEIN
jgi:outer membrane protein OmpA-like peptidoglycan-associated protein